MTDPFDISSHVATILDDGDIPLVSVSIEGKPNISRQSVHLGHSTCELGALRHVRSPNSVLDDNSKRSSATSDVDCRKLEVLVC